MKISLHKMTVGLLAVATAALVLVHSAQAADGTWTKLTSGNATGIWSDADTANWASGTVADGSGFTANFNTLNITADSTVSLGASRTIGNLIFGDTNTSTVAGWILDNGGDSARVLTLAGTTPTITVNALGFGKSVTVTAELAGTNGLTKAGVGTLTLSGGGSLSGGVSMTGGTWNINGAQAVSGGATVSSGNLVFGGTSTLSGPILNMGSFSMGTTTTLTGSSAFVQNGPNANSNLSGANTTFSGPITLNGGGLTGFNTNATNVLEAFGTSTITLGGPSTLRLIANSSANNSTATVVVVGNDVVVAGREGSISRIFGRRNSGSSANKILEFDTLTIGGGQTLETLGRDGYAIRFAGDTTLVGDAMLSPNSASLTLQGNVNDGGEGFGLAKTGTGTLFLTGTNTYSGATTIYSGILDVGATGLSTSSNLVLDGGVLQTTTATTFSGSLGSGAGQVQFGAAGGGFAARLAALIVNIGGSGSTLVWDSTPFFLGDGAALILGSTTAGNTTAFQNGIDLNGGARTITVNGTSGAQAQRLNGIISDSATGASLVKNGVGTLHLLAANTYAGTTNVNAGILVVGANTGSLNAVSDLTFSGTGTFNYDNANAASARAQTLDVLTFSKGDGTVQSTRTAGQDVGLTFTSLAARGTGATANFVVSLGTNGTNNSIVLTSATPNSFLGEGAYFGGNNYAYYDGSNFVRGVNWGTDAGSTTQAGGLSVATSTYAQTTDSVTAQQAATFTGLSIVNATDTVRAFTLDPGVTVTTNGILVTGGTGTTASTTLSGGTGIQAASGAELVIRTDGANDRLTISTPIIANGTNALTKSGAGSLTLRAANTYTGTTYVNAGTLALSGLTPASTTVIGGNIEINGGTLTNSTNGAVNAIATSANVTLNAGSYSQASALGSGVNQTLASYTQNGGSTTVSANQASSNVIVSGATTINAGTWTVGSGDQNAGTWTTDSLVITGGVNTIGVGGNQGGSTQLTVNAGGLHITQTASGPFTALTIANTGTGIVTSANPQMLLNGGLTYTANSSNPYATTIGDFVATHGNSNPVIRLNGLQTFNIGGHVGSTSPDLIIAPDITTTGGINKTGSGVLALEGANSYAGVTTVTTGTLLVNGTHTGGAAYTVDGKLGGNGSITAASLTTSAGAKLTPGNDGVLGNAFTFALAGGMDISASSTTGAYIFDLATTTTSDKITLTLGTLNLGTLDFADFAFNAVAGFGAGTYVLFDAATAITGSIGTAAGTIGGFSSTLSIDNLNNDVLLTVVPEPSTWALLAFSLMTVIFFRRRRA